MMRLMMAGLLVLICAGCNGPVPDARLVCASEVAVNGGGYKYYRWHARKADPSGLQCFIEDRLRVGFFIESKPLSSRATDSGIIIYDAENTPEDIKARLN